MIRKHLSHTISTVLGHLQRQSVRVEQWHHHLFQEKEWHHYNNAKRDSKHIENGCCLERFSRMREGSGKKETEQTIEMEKLFHVKQPTFPS